MKKNFVLILLMIMFLSVFSQVSAQVNDIGGHWGEDEIRYLIDKGIISGYNDGTFKPNRTITRAEFVSIVNEALGLTKVGQIKFNDVKQSWQVREVGKAVEAGYISGISETKFGPNNNLTRQDAATIIGRAFGFNEVNSISNPFKDANRISNYAKGYVNALSQKGYLNGYAEDNTFRPSNSIRRAEAATMAANTIKGETPAKPAPHKAEITNIEYIGENQVKITSTAKVNYKAVPLGNDRVYFDFQDTKLSLKGGTIAAEDSSNITSIRFSQFDNNPMTARVVFDLTGKYSYTNSSTANTTIITIEKDDKVEEPTEPELPEEPEEPTEPIEPEEPEETKIITKPSEATIILDPGHGGKDSGATGNGLLEKNINLPVALKLENELKKLGYNVLMTRRTDIDVSLSERSTMANKTDGDVFVSIHANAFNSKVFGLETFSYNKPKSPQGAILANSIHSEVLKNGDLYNNNRGVKTANFHVLRETKMTSALIELAFIDNASDAEILKTKQDDFGIAIANGIHKYFIENIFK